MSDTATWDTARLTELLRDAESCARLSQWEETFCDDMRARSLTRAEVTISEKQSTALDRIEAKVYAT
jgi:hypothetical protein